MQFGQQAIPTKKIGQIIDLKDGDILYDFSRFNKEKAKRDSIGGFKPGEMGLQ